MRLIVTGGAGFIGSNLVRHLNRLGYDDLVVVDDLTNADKCLNLNRARFIDLVDRNDFLTRLDQFVGVDTIFHLGACSATTEKDGRYLLENNINYSKTLLAWSQERSARLIYASSASVYGDGDDGFSDAAEAAEHPINGYAFSKWVFDRHIRRLAGAGALRDQVVGLRYFNVYGPQEWHKGGMCSPILHFHRQIQAEGVLKLFAGSDEFRRDFVAVEDCCAVNSYFLDHRDKSGIFNCGTGVARSFADVARLMVGRYPGATTQDVPFPDHLKGKYQAYTCADLTRLRAAGYDRPFRDLESGVAAYVDLLQSPSRGYFPAEKA